MLVTLDENHQEHKGQILHHWSIPLHSLTPYQVFIIR